MADTQKSGSGSLIFALGVALIGGLVAGWIIREQTLPAPAQPDLASALSTSEAPASAPDPAAVAAAESAQVQLYEKINQQFIGKLGEYGGRLKDIADVAEAEGAATAATQMREFASETDDLIARYNKIAKQ